MRRAVRTAACGVLLTAALAVSGCEHGFIGYYYDSPRFKIGIPDTVDISPNKIGEANYAVLQQADASGNRRLSLGEMQEWAAARGYGPVDRLAVLRVTRGEFDKVPLPRDFAQALREAHHAYYLWMFEYLDSIDGNGSPDTPS